jgi:hypothetical protein
VPRTDVGGARDTGGMDGDWWDPLDPLFASLWADWVCPDCADEGVLSELLPGGRCPSCRARVQQVT